MNRSNTSPCCRRPPLCPIRDTYRRRGRHTSRSDRCCSAYSPVSCTGRYTSRHIAHSNTSSPTRMAKCLPIRDTYRHRGRRRSGRRRSNSASRPGSCTGRFRLECNFHPNMSADDRRARPRPIRDRDCHRDRRTFAPDRRDVASARLRSTDRSRETDRRPRCISAPLHRRRLSSTDDSHPPQTGIRSPVLLDTFEPRDSSMIDSGDKPRPEHQFRSLRGDFLRTVLR